MTARLDVRRTETMPASVARLAARFEATFDALTMIEARDVMGYCANTAPDVPLATATRWLPGLYESDDGLLFLEGVVDDPEVGS